MTLVGVEKLKFDQATRRFRISEYKYLKEVDKNETDYEIAFYRNCSLKETNIRRKKQKNSEKIKMS